MEKITGKALKISFQPDWQTDNGFLNTPIMVTGAYSNPDTQVKAQNKDFSIVSQKDLTLVWSVTQARQQKKCGFFLQGHQSKMIPLQADKSNSITR